MSNAQAFEQAFRPTDDQIGRLDTLMNSVQRVNLIFNTGDILIDGEVYCVGPNGCEVCGTTHLTHCEHQQAVDAVVVHTIGVDDELYGDHRDEQADRAAVTVGVG